MMNLHREIAAADRPWVWSAWVWCADLAQRVSLWCERQAQRWRR